MRYVLEQGRDGTWIRNKSLRGRRTRLRRETAAAEPRYRPARHVQPGERPQISCFYPLRLRPDSAVPRRIQNGAGGRSLIRSPGRRDRTPDLGSRIPQRERSEEHTSELQSRQYLVCRLLLEKKKNYR